MAITITNLTSNIATSSANVVTGDGIFDDLMETVTAHLDAQYVLGRITGTQYAEVYLGALQSALSQAVAYTLGQETTNAQVLQILAQTSLIGQQELTEVEQTTLVTAQELKVDADVVSMVAATAVNNANSASEISTRSGQLTVNQADIVSTIALQTQQKLTEIEQTSVVAQQELISIAEKELIEQKGVTEFAQTGSATNSIPLTGSALYAQIASTTDRSVAEVSLLDQKRITEYAQTQQTTNTVPASGSILGKQATLYGEQSKGFQWNADQKYLKTLMDAWAINTSTAGVAATQITAINATGTDNLNTQIANAKPV